MLLGLAGQALASEDIYTVTKKDDGIYLCYDGGEGHCPFLLGDGGRCMTGAGTKGRKLACPVPKSLVHYTKKWYERVAAYKLLNN